jgi:hypothetical protein
MRNMTKVAYISGLAQAGRDAAMIAGNLFLALQVDQEVLSFKRLRNVRGIYSPPCALCETFWHRKDEIGNKDPN